MPSELDLQNKVGGAEVDALVEFGDALELLTCRTLLSSVMMPSRSSPVVI
jgi:hypothetical protein